MPAVVIALMFAACASSPPDHAGSAKQQIVRAYASPDAAYASYIVIPECHSLVRLSGVVADPVEADSGAKLAAFGDTETQVTSVLGKISRTLEDVGLSESDVVAMTIYLVAPTEDGVMDFAGMTRAYSRHYGSTAQPNRPVRSTVQVDGLVSAGQLVEIEATAARPHC